MEKDAKKKQLNYITYFRGIAILFIVAGHIIHWGEKDSLFLFSNYYIFRGCSIMFIFIAGFLFEYLSYKFEYKKYLISKFRNVIMPYWITMLPIALLFAFTMNNSKLYLFNYSPPIRLFNVLLFGENINAALWFVPFIAIIFLLSHIILKIKKYPLLFYGIMTASLLFCITQGRIITYISVEKCSNMDLLQYNLTYIKSCLFITAKFIGIYMLGMVSCFFIENHKDFINKYINNIFIISLIGWILLYFLFIHVLKITDNYKMDLGRIFLNYTILSLLIMYEKKIENNKIWNDILNTLANYSFGIFFIHYYIYYFLITGFLYRGMPIFSWQKEIVEKNTLSACLTTIGEVIIVVLASILVLYLCNLILIKIGVKNTRMFTGVSVLNKKQTGQ